MPQPVASPGFALPLGPVEVSAADFSGEVSIALSSSQRLGAKIPETAAGRDTASLLGVLAWIGSM